MFPIRRALGSPQLRISRWRPDPLHVHSQEGECFRSAVRRPAAKDTGKHERDTVYRDPEQGNTNNKTERDDALVSGLQAGISALGVLPARLSAALSGLQVFCPDPRWFVPGLSTVLRGPSSTSSGLKQFPPDSGAVGPDFVTQSSSTQYISIKLFVRGIRQDIPPSAFHNLL